MGAYREYLSRTFDFRVSKAQLHFQQDAEILKPDKEFHQTGNRLSKRH